MMVSVKRKFHLPGIDMFRKVLTATVIILLGSCIAECFAAESAASIGDKRGRKPNIIFILADDLGYGDVGCYGQQKIKTPNIDRMATEGIRFTQAYCGTSVCAPSRCSLMTGLDIGHAYIRGNLGVKPEGQQPIPANTFTVARMLQQAGYRTGCTGKWSLGGPGSTGEPNKQGFDYFFGYLCQTLAHEYYPDHLWRNSERIELGGKSYSHDLIAADALKWLRENFKSPFFLYVPFTIPHAKLQVPDLGPYESEKWPRDMKTFAAMITRMDSDVGRILALVKELGIDDNTIVFFSSDNGAPGGPTTDFFHSTGDLRSIKRSMYEGGLRIPMIARWPGHVPAGKISDETWAFWDFLPTCAELAGIKAPADATLDGISVLPALLGESLPHREFMYWEIHDDGSKQAVRMGNWKAVRPTWRSPVELYDLKTDSTESHNVAADHPNVLARAEELMKTARVDSSIWTVRPPPKKP